jgi:DNA polymerase
MTYSLSIDFETCSDLSLPEVGVFAYAEHPSTRILCMGWQRDDEPPSVWYPGDPVPVELLRDAAGISAWNVTFERVIWERIAVPRHNFPPRVAYTWRDPQARAKARNLPGSLDGAAAALGLPERKDEVGKKLMKGMSSGGQHSAADLLRLGEYCAQDVRVEVAASRRLPPLTEFEQVVLQASDVVNHNGVRIDRAFARVAAEAAETYQSSVATTMMARYGFGPRQVREVLEFCARERVVLPDLRADTVSKVLAAPDFYPPAVLDVLTMREKAAAAAPGKYAAMLRAVSADDRLRGMFVYCGAGQTGRWSGRIVQLHNLARPTMELANAMAHMDALRRAKTWHVLGDDPLDALLNCLRPTLIPGRSSRVFTVGDEASIEARVLPWLAGCTAPLRIFASGGDIYLHAAAQIYGRPITKANKAERQIGKVATLALGYGGGSNAFVTMGRGYGVHVDPEQAESIKLAWRAGHAEIRHLWFALESMALLTLLQGGAYVEPAIDPATGKCDALDAGALALAGGTVDERVLQHVHENLAAVGVRMSYVHGVHNKAGTLFIRLPSGRCIAYLHAWVSRGVQQPLYEAMRRPDRHGNVMPEAEARQRATRWRMQFSVPAGDTLIPARTYGGKLAENLTQAVARDVLAHAMVRFGAKDLVMHVHDELVAEGAHEDRMREALTTRPHWATRGIMPLPLDADVTIRERYWK